MPLPQSVATPLANAAIVQFGSVRRAASALGWSVSTLMQTAEGNRTPSAAMMARAEGAIRNMNAHDKIDLTASTGAMADRNPAQQAYARKAAQSDPEYWRQQVQDARNRRQADRMGSTPDTEVYEAIRSSAPAR